MTKINILQLDSEVKKKFNFDVVSSTGSVHVRDSLIVEKPCKKKTRREKKKEISNQTQIFEVVWWSTLVIKPTATTKFVSVSV